MPNKETPVLVTTAHRGVFFGYSADYDGGKTIALRKARNCLRWSENVRGFVGLAVTGPSKECRVGPAADLTLQDVTSVAVCTPESVTAWESAPWSLTDMPEGSVSIDDPAMAISVLRQAVEERDATIAELRTNLATVALVTAKTHGPLLADQINAAPAHIRRYITDLEQRADPAADVRRAHVAEETAAALERQVQEPQAELAAARERVAELEQRERFFLITIRWMASNGIYFDEDMESWRDRSDYRISIPGHLAPLIAEAANAQPAPIRLTLRQEVQGDVRAVTEVADIPSINAELLVNGRRYLVRSVDRGITVGVQDITPSGGCGG